MPIFLTLSIQDTTVVAVARDGLGLASAWMTVGMGVAFVAILVVLMLVLAELRHLSRAWSGFLAVTTDRSQPLVEHANNAARNLDHITQVARSEVDRVSEALGGFADDIGDASQNVRGRVADLSALLDLAQSEAEDAVLDAAAKVRMLRTGAGLLRWAGTKQSSQKGDTDDGPVGAPPASEDEPGHEDEPDHEDEPGHEDESGREDEPGHED